MQQPRRSGPGAIPDDTLAEQAQSGDVTAFNALVERYQRPVFGLSLRMLGSPAAAEDAAQEAFFSAWRAIDRLPWRVVPGLDPPHCRQSMPG